MKLIEQLEVRRHLDAAPIARVFAESSSLVEGTAPAVVARVVLDAPAAADVTVAYAVGGAAASVVVPAGERSAALIYAPPDDAVAEPPEAVALMLQPGAGYVLGLPGERRALLRVYDDDATVAGGVELLDPTDAAWNFFGEPGTGAFVEPVDAVGVPFAVARRVTSTSAAPAPYNTQLLKSIVQPVAQGNTVRARFWLRNAGPAEAKIDVAFEQAFFPYEKSAIQHFALPANSGWQSFQLAFAAEFAFGTTAATNPAHLSFQLGYGPQAVEVGGVSVDDLGTTVAPGDLFTSEPSYDGRSGAAPWRAAAEARIEQHRKGDLAVSVVDHLGAAVEGASVRARLVENAFGFGTAVRPNQLNAAQWDAEFEIYRAKIVELFNTVTIEGELQWPAWGQGWGDQASATALAWLADNGLTRVRGHAGFYPLWDRMPASPGESYEGVPYRVDANKPDAQEEYEAHVQVDGEAAAAEWLRTRARAHVTEKLSDARFADLESWDVVNEPYPTRNAALGPLGGDDEVIAQHTLARAANPNAKLFVNDYPNPAGGAHLEADYALLQRMRDEGVPVDGFGFQGHYYAAGDASVDATLETYDRFAALGLDLQVTEFDFLSADAQYGADLLRDQLTLAYSHPAMTAFVLWGFWDAQHWRPGAGLYDAGWNLTPNGQAFLDLVKATWSTDATLDTDAGGAALVHGHAGRYEVDVTFDGVTTRAVATLYADGTALTVTLPNGQPPRVLAAAYDAPARRYTVTFSEPVAGLTASDFAVTRGGATVVPFDLAAAGDAATLTFAADVAPGTLAVALAGGSYADADANGGVAFAGTFEVPTPDVAAPDLQLGAYDVDRHRATVAYNEPVALAPDAAPALLNATTGQPLDAALYEATVVGAELRVDLAADAPDGWYHLTLPAGGLRDAWGNPAAAVSVWFFALVGDANRDQRVDFQDLAALAANYGQANRTWAQGNFDRSPDGAVTFADLALLAARYGTSFVFERPAAVTATSARRTRVFDDVMAR